MTTLPPTLATTIDQTLILAQQALANYRANPKDALKLRFCITHLHQLYRSLRTVDIVDAALLAKELEQLAQAVSLTSLVKDSTHRHVSHGKPTKKVDDLATAYHANQGPIHPSHMGDAIDTLQQGIEQLTQYIKRIQTANGSLPTRLVPILNDCRALRGIHLLSETLVFAPTMGTESTATPLDTDAPSSLKPDRFQHRAGQIRKLFQMALLGFMRHRDFKNLHYLAKVCHYLQSLTTGHDDYTNLWQATWAVISTLPRSLKSTRIAIIWLLRQVDQQIKPLVEQGTAALTIKLPQALLNNLLYYVAYNTVDNDDVTLSTHDSLLADAQWIDRMKARYKLAQAFLGHGTCDEQPLTNPIKQSLNTTIDETLQRLSLISPTENTPAQRQQLYQVIDTLALLRWSDTLKSVEQRYESWMQLAASPVRHPTPHPKPTEEKLALHETEPQPIRVLTIIWQQQPYLLPLTSLDAITRLSISELAVYHQPRAPLFHYRNHHYRVRLLHECWPELCIPCANKRVTNEQRTSHYRPVLLLHHHQQRVAIPVDKLCDARDVMIDSRAQLINGAAENDRA